MRHPLPWSLLAIVLAMLLCGCRRAPVPVPLSPDVTLPLPPVTTVDRGAVIGIVADSALGYPIARAVVYVTGDTVVSLNDDPVPLPAYPIDSTDPRGGFALGDITPGEHTLAIRHPGYTTRRHVVVILGDVVDTVVVRLQERIRVPP